MSNLHSQTVAVNAATRAIAKFDFIGFHSWPEATGNRAYLAQPHRHKFYVRAEIQTFHDDREIEFHDFLDFCKQNAPGGDLGRSSCEDIGRQLLTAISKQWPNRAVYIEVWEDHEVGASLYHHPQSLGDTKI